MQNINTNDILKYSKELSLLYVEDDIELQEQTKELLTVLFKSVKIADDGAQALKLYNEEYFDLLITDIKMPNMDGMELIEHIKEINPAQCIIITSAYNDAENLLRFINIGIQQFIIKPINFSLFQETLYKAAKVIVNEKNIESYRKKLEKTNNELNSKNSELQSLVRILDSKLAQISKETDSVKVHTDLESSQLSKESLDELDEYEIDISGAVVLISLSKNLSIANITVLGELFISYADVISKYEEYDQLTSEIRLLGEKLSSHNEVFLERIEDISILLESFIYVLRMWRKNIKSHDIQKAFALHASMINDISTIVSIIDGTENDIEGEMEFF